MTLSITPLIIKNYRIMRLSTIIFSVMLNILMLSVISVMIFSITTDI
jgi:hypothetical protein